MSSSARAETAAGVPARTVPLSQRALIRADRTPMWLTLTGLIVFSAAIRFALALTSPAPWIIPDELIYSELARSFADSGHFMVRELPFSAWTYGPLYAVLISPAYLFGTSPADAYVIVKAINCVLMSLAALPAYLLGRRLLRRNGALLLALLAVLLPSAIYTTKIMTESAAYPIFLVAILTGVRLLENPTSGRQLAALGALAVAVLARAEMIVLAPALLTACVLVAGLDAREVGQPFLGRWSMARIFRLRVICLTILGAAGVCLALALARGSSPTALMGAHEVLLHRVRPHLIAAWFAYHVADLDLYTGVVPLGAFLIVVVMALRSTRSSRPLRTFAALSAAASVWMLLLAAIYGTQRRASPHVFDRYVFYLVPLFTLGFLFWIEQGFPRPKRLTWLVAVCVGLLPLTLPLGSFVDGREWGTSSSTVALVPWFWVSLLVGHGIVLSLAAGAFASALAITFVRVPAGKGVRLVRVVALNFVVITLFTLVGNAVVAERARRYAGARPLGWIDSVVGKGTSVPVVWPARSSDERREFAIWENELFNRSVGPVYALSGELSDSLPAVHVRVDGSRLVRRDGAPIHANYALADDRIKLRGRIIGRDDASRLVLYRVNGPIEVEAKRGS